MQRYKKDNIAELLLDIENCTADIENCIASGFKMDLEAIELLGGLYEKRQKSLEILYNFYESDECKKIFEIENSALKKRINNLFEIDKKIFKKIENRVEDLKENIRKLAKQKSLIIYSK